MQRFNNILCVVAPDVERDNTLEHAVTLANNNQARLTVVEIVDEIPPNTKLLERVLSPVDLQAMMIEEHRQRLEEMVKLWNENVEIQIKVLSGLSFLEIIREVLRSGHDMVIKTAESSGPLERVFGSDDMHLLRKCPCPVWLFKPQSPKTYRCIMAAVDVDDSYPPEELNTRHLLNLQVLEMASSLAVSEFTELHIVHVWHAILESTMRGAFINRPEEEVVAYVEDERQQHQQNLNILVDEAIGNLEQNTLEHINPHLHLLKGSPRSEIPVLAEEIKADLVVMGTVARTGISGLFMGNTAETILNQLNCSVLAIKPPGFITPVSLEE